MDNEKLATELLHELKAQAHRWFIIAVVEFIALVIIILVYLVVPAEESTSIVDQDAVDTQTTQMIGGDYNGQSTSDNSDNLQEEKP